MREIHATDEHNLIGHFQGDERPFFEEGGSVDDNVLISLREDFQDGLYVCWRDLFRLIGKERSRQEVKSRRMLDHEALEQSKVVFLVRLD